MLCVTRDTDFVISILVFAAKFARVTIATAKILLTRRFKIDENECYECSIYPSYVLF